MPSLEKGPSFQRRTKPGSMSSMSKKMMKGMGMKATNTSNVHKSSGKDQAKMYLKGVS